MFKQRFLTTLMIVPLVVLGIYYGHWMLLGAIILFLMTMMGIEWIQLIPLQSFQAKVIFLGALFLCLVVVKHVLYGWLLLGAILWVLILSAVLFFPMSQRVWGHRAVVTALGLFLLPLWVEVLWAIYDLPQGKDLLIYVFCLIWATDIGAYLIGKPWGRHKLIPRVSPGKTYEGALGGVLIAMVVTTLGYFYFKPEQSLVWSFIGLGTALFSMLGDLFVSMLKRRCGMKDTGHFFPGHGGVLDRLDSMVAALPFFYVCLCYIHYYTFS